LKPGLKEAPNLLRRTLAKRFDGKKTELVRFLAGAHSGFRGRFESGNIFQNRS